MDLDPEEEEEPEFQLDTFEGDPHHYKNKKSFMSTAPITAFLPRQPIGFSMQGMGQQRQKLKVKESKEELKEYQRQLEDNLSKVKQQYLELEKDHEDLLKTQARE